MDDIKGQYLGMKTKQDVFAKRLLEKRVITYFIDLETSVKEMTRVLKKGGQIAIVIGNSSLEGRKLPTTQKHTSFACSMVYSTDAPSSIPYSALGIEPFEVKVFCSTKTITPSEAKHS